MQVILLRDVSGVGQAGDIKDVSDGYALNSLIPRKLAAQATPQKIAEHKEWQKATQEAREKKEAEWAKYAERLRGADIVIPAEANKQGKLYRQITPEIVSEHLKKLMDISVPPDAIRITEPLRKVGESTVRIHLGKSSIEIIVRVQAA